MKKLLSILLAAMMLLSLGTVAFASETAGTTDSTQLKVLNATNGQTYKYYKIFDASFSTVTVPDTTPGAEPGATTTTQVVTYLTNEAKKIRIENMNDDQNDAYDSACPFVVSPNAQNGKYAVSLKDGVQDSAVISWLQAPSKETPAQKNYAYIGLEGPTTMTVSNGQAVATVTPGYYYITTTLGSVVTVDSALPGVNVYDKNPASPSEPDKKITGEGTDGDHLSTFDPGKDTNESAVGKTEQFTVTYEAVNYINVNNSGTYTTEKVTEWVITDTPTGLDIDETSVKVYVTQPKADTNPQQLEDRDVTATATIAKNDTTGALTITLPWVNHSGAHLYSVYTDDMKIPVKVVYNATVLPEAADAPAPNTVNVSYHRDGDSSPHSIGDDTTTTYTYAFKVIKVDGNQNALLGAEFQLLDNGTPIVFVQVAGGYRVATAEEIADNSVTTTDTISLTAAGLNSNQAVIKGLDLGTYTLREVTVPDGYNRAADQTIVVTSSEDTGVVKVLTQMTASATPGETTVINKSGSELPETGGIGTRLFYVAGAILFLGAGAILVARRKSSDR